MSKLHEQRIEFLQLVKDGELNRNNLKEKGFSTSKVDQFKHANLVQGGLDNLQLSPQGHTLLNQHELKDATESLSSSVDDLQEIMEKFKESSSQQNDKMLSESKAMNRLTWAVLIATITNLGITAYQVIL